MGILTFEGMSEEERRIKNGELDNNEI